jgi:diadenosine tetraphosphatase ApaH/serine/threonine PP2A family protein phosphatase
MKIAFFADIHANREALEACLAHAAAQRSDRLVFLGDYVDYGGDPEWVVAAVRDAVAAGAIAVRGNHDEALTRGDRVYGLPGESTVAWTRARLSAADREFLASLPLTVEEESRLYVHAEATAPPEWTYVMDSHDAIRSLDATPCRLTFVGHVHRPALYNLSPTGKLTAFRPAAGIPVPLLVQRRWLAVVGSVGQPRDGDPAAAYTLLDTATMEATFHRVPYDVDAAAAKIRDAGLPELFAARLAAGR